jgi:hypothetical protein
MAAALTRVTILLWAIILLGFLNASASSPANAGATADVTGTSFLADPYRDQVNALAAQNQILKEFQSDLITTVYWSLGVLAAVFLVLIGYNWFTSFKEYEKNKASLKQELLGEVELKIAENNESIFNLKREALSEVDNRITQQFLIATQNFVSTGDHQKSLDEIDAQLATIRDNAQARDDFFERRYQYAMLVTREIEEWMWEEKQVFGNILIAQSDTLAAAIKYDSDYFTKSVLERILSKIDAIFGQHKERTISTAAKHFLLKELENVPSPHVVLANSIKEKLAVIPVHDIIEPSNI